MVVDDWTLRFQTALSIYFFLVGTMRNGIQYAFNRLIFRTSNKKVEAVPKNIL